MDKKTQEKLAVNNPAINLEQIAALEQLAPLQLLMGGFSEGYCIAPSLKAAPTAISPGLQADAKSYRKK